MIYNKIGIGKMLMFYEGLWEIIFYGVYFIIKTHKPY
jgi:hypothetical protein